jgi:hypothetical protein
MRKGASALLLVLVVGGCGGGESTDTRSGTVTTATTAQATTTTAAPSTLPPKAVDAAGIVDKLKSASVPIGEVRVYTAADDPNEQLGRPGGYTSKASWHDTRLEQSDDFDVDGGGSVEVFGNDADAKTRYDYVDGITRGNAMLNEYHWVKGAVFLRVSKTLTPDQSAAYEKVLTAG